MTSAWTFVRRLFILAVCVIFFSAIPAASAQTPSRFRRGRLPETLRGVSRPAGKPRAFTRFLAETCRPWRILRTLDFGLMMGIAYPIKREEREGCSQLFGDAGGEPRLRRAVSARRECDQCQASQRYLGRLESVTSEYRYQTVSRPA